MHRIERLLAFGQKTSTSVQRPMKLEAADLHPTYVSVVERGLKSPTIFTLTKLANALGRRPSELLATADGS